MINISLPSEADIEARANDYPPEHRADVVHAALNQNKLLTWIAEQPTVAHHLDALNMLIGAFGSLGASVNVETAQACANQAMRCSLHLASMANQMRQTEAKATGPNPLGQNVMPPSPHTH